MSTGLIALLDDVVSIAKVAAASIDDVAGQAAKAGAKSAGVAIDDAAVTPKYVVGFAAARELPIIAKIARGSLKNKLLFLLPAALTLSAVAPWAITPLLMMGALFLCYEVLTLATYPLVSHKGDEKTVRSARVIALVGDLEKFGPSFGLFRTTWSPQLGTDAECFLRFNPLPGTAPNIDRRIIDSSEKP